MIQLHKDSFSDLTEAACTKGFWKKYEHHTRPNVARNKIVYNKGMAVNVPDDWAECTCPAHIVANKCKAAGALYLLPVCTYTGRKI